MGVGEDAPDAIAAIASIDLSPSGVRRTLCQSLCVCLVEYLELC